MDISNSWFEDVRIQGRNVRHVSKFLRSDFSVPLEVIEGQWSAWTAQQKLEFAAAFSARAQLDGNDQRVLRFLMDNGDPHIWGTIALSITRLRDREEAIKFLVARVGESKGLVANYYQALAMLAASEAEPILVDALSRHRTKLAKYSGTESGIDKSSYLDYVSCSTALLAITGNEKYRALLKEMQQHSDENVRKMVQVVVSSVKLDPI